MTNLIEEQLLEDKEMRQELIERVEVLDSVKKIVLLSKDKITVMNVVADYYEVGYDTIKKLVQRNESELSQNGMKHLKYAELKDVFAGDMLSLPKLSTRGSNVFSKRAVLNVGMLLRDSRIAREVRNQLLNGHEKLTIEQKVEEISREDRLLLAVGKATTPVERMIAAGELNNYHNRHKAELNVRIDEMKPKEEAYDTFIDAGGFQRMNDVAKSIGYGRNKLFRFLREQGVLMKDNVPYESYITREWFVVRQSTIANKGYSKNYVQTFATPKGVNGISKMMKKYKLIS